MCPGAAYREGMLTVGVDLAAEATNTAVAWLDWSAEGASARDLVRGVSDDVIVEAISQADKAGVDCPFGWPESFVTFISAHRDDQLPPPKMGKRPGRPTLARRRPSGGRAERGSRGCYSLYSCILGSGRRLR